MMQEKCSRVDGPLHPITTSPLSVNYTKEIERSVSLPHQTASSVSYINPLFHFTSPDVSISAMEHNNHCKLLAIATSSKQLFVVETQMMPVMDKTFQATAAHNSKSPTPTCTPPFDRRLINWSLKEMSTCINVLPAVATQLNWGPWQYGVHLAAMCPRREIRLYRFSHACWLLQARIFDRAVVSFAFSPNFMLTCACGEANVVLYSQIREDDLHETPNELGSTQTIYKTSNKRNNNGREPMESLSNINFNNGNYHHNNDNNYNNINKHLNKLEKWAVCGRIDNSTNQGIAVNINNDNNIEIKHSINGNDVSSVGDKKMSATEKYDCIGDSTENSENTKNIKKVSVGVNGKQQPHHSFTQNKLGLLQSKKSEVIRQEKKLLHSNQIAITQNAQLEQNLTLHRHIPEQTTNVEQCICVDWNDDGSLLAVAYANNIIKIYKCNNINADAVYIRSKYANNEYKEFKHYSRNNTCDVISGRKYSVSFDLLKIFTPREICEETVNSQTRSSIFSHLLRTHTNVSEEDRCVQVVWAPSSGRSFSILAGVFTTHIVLYFLQESIQNNANSESDTVKSKINHGQSTDRAALTRTQISASTNGFAPRERNYEEYVNHGVHTNLTPMHCVAVCSVECSNVVKLSWNNTGTRFVTAQYDHKMKLWEVRVRYTRMLGNETADTHNTDINQSNHDIFNVEQTFNKTSHSLLKAHCHEITQIEPYQAFN